MKKLVNPIELPQEISLDPLRIKLGHVGIDYVMNVDGSEVSILFLWKNPFFPVAIEVPFRPPYLDRHIEKLQDLLTRALEAQKTYQPHQD